MAPRQSLSRRIGLALLGLLVLTTSLAANSRANVAGAYVTPSVETKTERFDNPNSPLYGMFFPSYVGHSDPTGSTYRDNVGERLVMRGHAKNGDLLFYGNVESLRVRCVIDANRSAYSSTGRGGNCWTRLLKWNTSQGDTISALTATGTWTIHHAMKVSCKWNTDPAIDHAYMSGLDVTSGPAVANMTVGPGGDCDRQADVVWTTPQGFGIYRLQCFTENDTGGMVALAAGTHCTYDDVKGWGRTWRFSSGAYRQTPEGSAHADTRYPPGTSFLISGSWVECSSTTYCPSEPPPTPNPVPTCTNPTALTAAQLAVVVKQVGFEGEDQVRAVATALDVSGGHINYIGAPGSGGPPGHLALGVMGISTARSQFSRTRLVSDAAYNIAAAFVLTNGGEDWSVFPSETYQSKMSEAREAVTGTPYTGAISCRGSMNGVPTTSDPAGPWVEDDGDGETGCGFTINVVAAFGCVLRWAFVPRVDELTDATDGVAQDARSTIPGVYMTKAFEIWNGIRTAVEHPNASPYKVDLNEYVVGLEDVYIDPEDVAGQTDDDPSGGGDGFLVVRYVITGALWMAVAGRMWRSLPWSKGRDSGEPA